ncbi:MAG: coenzyme F420-0:L-glutamate ligase [Betaproteobacteria bacterium]|nr:coenzyme F420-0:L-glutamate ligase [Betaproteobacteria bacterium]
MSRELKLVALPGMPEVAAGADLATLLRAALSRARLTLQNGDILVLAQKIISKAEGRAVRLSDVTPCTRAQEFARQGHKDPRVVELMLRESRKVLRVKPGVIIVEHQLGFIMANAGIDHSNVPDGEDTVLLLPENPDASARTLRDQLRVATGAAIGVLIIDSFGRAWRHGVTGMAIGIAGFPALIDMRGQKDRDGRELRVTQIAAADELAAAASLLMGQADEGTPAVLARGFPYALRESTVQELIRPENEDLFR